LQFLAHVPNDVSSGGIDIQAIQSLEFGTGSPMNDGKMATNLLISLIRNRSKKRSEINVRNAEVQDDVMSHHWSKANSVPTLGCLNKTIFSKSKLREVTSHSEDLCNLPRI
jgi:hypothetical protein